ncbi:hypothetical protein QJQ45_007481 [Haematococcus lacustris]|nr:hypothetical protein QJQ45_007481 [Haematococcus lacustris]
MHNVRDVVETGPLAAPPALAADATPAQQNAHNAQLARVAADATANLKACNIILQFVSNQHARDVSAAPTAKQAWDQLSAEFVQVSVARQSQLQTQLSQLRMQPEESVAQFFSRTMLGGTTGTTLDAVKKVLLQAEADLQQEQQLQPGPSLFGSSFTYTRAASNPVDPEQTNVLFMVRQSPQFPKLSRTEPVATPVPDHIADAMQMTDEQHLDFYSRLPRWVIDSGANKHVMPWRSCLSDYRSFNPPIQLQLGGSGSSINVLGQGTTYLTNSRGDQWKVTGVLHAPQAAHCYLSVSELTRARVSLRFQQDSCELLGPGDPPQWSMRISRAAPGVYLWYINAVPHSNVPSSSDDDDHLYDPDAVYTPIPHAFRMHANELDPQLPPGFWVDAALKANYVRNLLPITGQSLTPWEAFYQRKPDLSALRVFGATAWVYVTQPNRHKLQPKAVKGIFLGYAVGSKAYKLWVGGKVVVSKDVHIDETAVLQNHLKMQQPVQASLTATPSPAAPVYLTTIPPTPDMQPPAQRQQQQQQDSDRRSSPSPSRRSASAAGGEASSSTSSSAAQSSGSDSSNFPSSDSSSAPSAPAPSGNGSPGVGSVGASHQLSSGIGRFRGPGPCHRGPRPHPLLPPPASPVPSVAPILSNASQPASPSAPDAPAPRRYPQRQHVMPVRFRQPELNSVVADSMLPSDTPTVLEALSGPHADSWREAMHTELASLHANGTWTLVERPSGARVLPTKWVLKIKRDATGAIEKFKARLVAKGFMQVSGVDVGDVYAPVSKHTTLRALLALAAARDMEVHQIDVEAAFLNGTLQPDEVIYVQQPEGFEEGSPNTVCRLQKALYGLRQAPRAWHAKLKQELEGMGFFASESDPALFMLPRSSGTVYLLVYVDDCLLCTEKGDFDSLNFVKQRLSSVFGIKDLGQTRWFLGMQISRDRAQGTLQLDQQQYIKELLSTYSMTEAHSKAVPMAPGTKLVKEGDALDIAHNSYSALVGSLLYLSCCTRPDIAYAVGALARHMASPTQQHWAAAKTVLSYLNGTVSQGLVFGGNDSLQGYCDADYAGDKDTARSTTGYVFTLHGAAISWSSRLQPTVAMSTAEAEYMAASGAVKEAVWLRKLMQDLGLPGTCVNIMCDNQAALQLLNNPMASARSKHISVHHHFARERAARGEVMFTYCSTSEMVADVMTKPLAAVKLGYAKEGCGISSL